MTNRIVFIDHTGKIDHIELARVAAAIEKQVNEHFALPPPHGYGIRCMCRADSAARIPSEWILGLFTDPDQPGALGYHDEKPDGTPVIKVFPFLDDGPWSVTASHEVLETLADPNICRAAQSTAGMFWAYEVCDAVERDTYEVDGVAVSNFVLPPYFEAVDDPKAKLDHLGLVHKPLEIRPGGYGQYWGSGQWHEVDATKTKSEARAKLHSLGLSRRARRRGRIAT